MKQKTLSEKGFDGMQIEDGAIVYREEDVKEFIKIIEEEVVPCHDEKDRLRILHMRAGDKLIK